jgi:hypothetical protein
MVGKAGVGVAPKIKERKEFFATTKPLVLVLNYNI